MYTYSVLSGVDDSLGSDEDASLVLVTQQNKSGRQQVNSLGQNTYCKISMPVSWIVIYLPQVASTYDPSRN